MMGRRLHGPSDEVYAWVLKYFPRLFNQGGLFFEFLSRFFEKFCLTFDPRPGVLDHQYTRPRVESIRLSRQTAHRFGAYLGIIESIVSYSKHARSDHASFKPWY